MMKYLISKIWIILFVSSCINQTDDIEYKFDSRVVDKIEEATTNYNLPSEELYLIISKDEKTLKVSLEEYSKAGSLLQKIVDFSGRFVNLLGEKIPLILLEDVLYGSVKIEEIEPPYSGGGYTLIFDSNNNLMEEIKGE